MPRKAFRKQGSGPFGNTETEEYAEHPWAETKNAKHAVVPRHAIFHFGLKQTCDWHKRYIYIYICKYVLKYSMV